MFKDFSVLLLSCFLLGCKSEIKPVVNTIDSTRLTKTWRLTEVLLSENFISESSRFDQRVIQGQIGQGYLLNLFPNQLSSKLTGNDLSIGDWSFTNDSLLIINSNEVKDTFITQAIEDNKGYTFLSCKYKNEGIYKFVKEHDMLDDILQDPYHPENNKWRTPSKVYESNTQLKNRLINYLNHTRLLLTSTEQRSNGKIRLGNSLGPIRVYNGGLGLRGNEALPKEWLHTYYSDSQAYEMVDLLSTHFKNRLIKNASNKDWKAADIEILNSLISKVK